MKKKSVLIVLWTIVAAGAALRIALALRCYYDPEEFLYINAVKIRDFERFFYVMREFRTGCLDIYCLKALYAISTNEIFIRSCYAAIAVVYIATVYVVASKMSGSDFTGLAAAAMVAFSSLHIFYSQIVRYHNFINISAALSIYYFFILIAGDKKPRARDYCFYGLSTALAMMFHYYALYLVAAQGAAFLFMRGREAAKWTVYAVSQVAAFVFFLPWLPLFIYHMKSRVETSSFGIKSVLAEFAGTGVLNIADAIINFILGDFWLIHDDDALTKTMLLAALAFITTCGLFALRRYARARDRHITFLMIILIATTLMSFATRPLTGMAFHPKFLLPFSFTFFIIIVYGIEDMRGAARMAAGAAGVFIAAGCFSAMITSAMATPTIKTVPAEIAAKHGNSAAVAIPTQACAEQFRDNGGAKMKIFAATDRTSVPGYMYYEEANDEEVAGLMKSIKGYDTVWAFYCLLGYERNIGSVPSVAGDEKAKMFRAISAHYSLVETRQFKISPRKYYFVSRAYRFEKKRL